MKLFLTFTSKQKMELKDKVGCKGKFWLSSLRNNIGSENKRGSWKKRTKWQSNLGWDPFYVKSTYTPSHPQLQIKHNFIFTKLKRFRCNVWATHESIKNCFQGDKYLYIYASFLLHLYVFIYLEPYGEIPYTIIHTWILYKKRLS